jgi:hypothetical protein
VWLAGLSTAAIETSGDGARPAFIAIQRSTRVVLSSGGDPAMLNRSHTLMAALIMLMTTASQANAQNVAFGALDASLDDGSLAGTTFQVAFSYDADQVADVGDSYVPLLSFDFTLLGATFSRDWIFQGGQAIFQDGVLQNVTASFQVYMPPDSPVNNITFGFGGDGMIGYIDLDGQFGLGSFTFESTDGCSP